MGRYIHHRSIAGAWEESLGLFREGANCERYESSRGGPSLEIEDLMFDVDDPCGGAKTSDLFPSSNQSLVDDFTNKLISKKEGGSFNNTSERLFFWKGHDGQVVDQYGLLAGQLSERRVSRRGLISFWDPAQDPFSSKPVSALLAYFRIRSESLSITVVARSVEAWIGALPILVGFANMQELLATQLSVGTGGMRFLALSYHMIEIELAKIPNRRRNTQKKGSHRD